MRFSPFGTGFPSRRYSNALCKVLLAFNLLLFAALLVLRFTWTRTGKVDWLYLDEVQGWQRLWRRLVNYTLIMGPVWTAAFAVLFFAFIQLKLAGPIP